MAWTKAQQSAIEDSGNILVSAAAGSGKTSVLTERVTRLVREGARVTELLVVTFTNAAAAEMKKRIGKSLLKAAAETEDEAEATRLLAASAAVPMANISTLHAFCGTLLRRHFHLAGLDPAFRGLDEADSRAMRSEAMDALLEKLYIDAVPDELMLADALGGEKRLMEAIDGIYDFMNKRPDPEAWLANAEAVYAAGAAAFITTQPMADYASAVKKSVALAGVAADKLSESTDGGVSVTLSNDAETARFIAEAESLDQLAERIRGASFGRLTFPRDTADVLKAEPKRVHEAVKRAVKNAAEGLSAVLDDDELQSQLPLASTLFSLTRRYRDAYAEAKRARGVIDFDDMEHLALTVLADRNVRDEYRARFKYIMVDEYQDSNAVQEAVINAIRRPDGLFLVGDVKQSIYRFRLADPGLFLNKYAQYSGGAEGKTIDLTTNFRSSRAVVNAVNAVFSAIMSRDCGDIDYDSRAALDGHREDEGYAELTIIDEDGVLQWDDDDADENEDEPPNGVALEARVAAERIRELQKDGVRFGDIAILLRAARGVAPIWAETLASEGVPVYSEVNGVLTESVEIRTLTDLLRIIDNRRQDIPLAAVMLSPIGGFTAEELAELRCINKSKDASFFDCVNAARELPDAIGLKTAAFMTRLGRWQEESLLYPVDEFILRLLRDTGYSEYVAALPGGARRVRNLAGLADRAAAAAESGADSIAAFTAYMDAAGTGFSEAPAAIGDADVVRIMSVHKSKGLEYPVVILGGLGRKFRLGGQNTERVLTDVDCGVAMRLDYGPVRRDNALWRLVTARRARESLAEEMRILYVAMTRARDRLIMIGRVKKLYDKLCELAAPVTPLSVGSAGNYMDWLLSVVMNDGSGKELREIIEAPPLVAPSPIAVRVVKTAGAVSLALPPMPRPKFVSWARAAAAEHGAEAADRFTWEYPYLSDTHLPAKTSVTGVTGGAPEVFPRPAFMEADAPMSATDRGTAAHALMEHISIAPHTAESVAAERDRLAEAGRLSPAMAEAVDCEAVARFFASPLGTRLIAADRRERELEFCYRIPASRLYPDASDKPILLQGVIDCAFIEDGGWVIIDYKTDRLRGTAAETAEHHRPQLTLYAEALAALTGVPVREAWIHLLRYGDSVPLI